jgi:regulatory protein
MAEVEVSREKLEQRTRNVLLHQLSRSAKTESQCRQLLTRREIPAEVFEPILKRFVESQLIDDLAFAKGFVASRLARGGKSRSAIARELSQKGVASHHIDVALEVMSPESELEAATELALSRMRRMGNLEPEVMRRRITGLLMRRGYSSYVTSQALRNASSQG